MEKFNPNKKRWEPLWGDTSVDLTGFLSDKTVKKCAPAPKDLKEPEIPKLPKNFEGPDYSKEDSNEFKDLYLVKYYPNHDRSSIEVYALGDLGRVPENSIWGGVEYLRELFEDYKQGIRRSRNSDKSLGYYNNCIWYVATAKNVAHALTLFWSALKGEK